jgi:hypothetical protein
MKYVIEESKFVWNGSGWEYYTEYTTHDVGSVVFESGSAQELYLIRADGEAFEIVSTEDDINWTAAFAIRAGSGVGIKLNGVQISMENSVKFPAQMYINLGAAAQVGDMLEIGGTFYNVDLGVEYVIAENVLIFNGEAWTDYLTSAKDSAKTQLDNYLAENFSQDNYYEEQWAEMAAIVENAKASIDKAKTEADLAPIVEKAKEDFGTVLLKDAVDVLLTDVKANAKADLAVYKEKANYNDAEWATIEGILADANAKIDAVHSEAAVAEAVAEAKAAMDKVLTAEQATAAQLKAWREEATKEVQAYYSALDFKLYSSEENATLTGYLQTALATIESATAKEDIDGAVAQFKASVDSMKKTSTDDSASQDDTVAEEDILTKIKKMVGCESVVGSSVALSGIGLAAAAVVALRKKEDNE